ncbi:MAG: cobalt-precorrin 5A hydrolase [Eubacteriales bacterium]|nr:cobalt-precorrin 5A hydrolase [Eubacteriales bacterium]
MKRAAILYFTDRGAATAERIQTALQEDWEVSLHRPHGGERSIVETLFQTEDALIFVGACGIAVRAIAPFVRSKTTDPAVIVVDELGRQAISLLSGHIGGANALTRRIAADIGGIPVITTATDLSRRFAADEWAARNGLIISSMKAAKDFAVEILRRDLPLYSDFPIEGTPPGGLYLYAEASASDCGLAISCRNIAPFDKTLALIPRILHLGIGCKRHTPAENIRRAVQAVLEEANLSPRALKSVASIDVKRDEAGLIEYCASANLPLSFYSAEELRSLPGSFTPSNFVQNTVGVDNVCERAAMRAAGEGATRIVNKTCLDGVTVAVAQEKWSACFE